MNMRLHLSSYYKWLLVCSGVLVALVTSLALVNLTLAQAEEPVANADEHVVSIYDRGEERVIVTKARNIRGALKAANIELQEKQDVVEPGLDTELVASKYNVNIFRARPVTIVDGTVRQRVTTAHQTPEQIAKTAGITLHKEDTVALSGANDLLVDGADTVMKIDRATPIQLTLYGKKAVVRTHVATVAELLKEKGITLSKDDTLSVAPNTKLSANLSVEVWRNGVQTVTQEEDIAFPVEKIQDANREMSYREVKEAGEAGKKNVTYEIEMRNGQEVSRKEIASVTTKEPKRQVEVVGAKLPTPTSPTESQKIGKEMMLAAGYAESEWGCLYNLWMRESGWRTTAGNVSSGAYGIPQSLPASKMASYGSDYLTNPRTQIAWGLNYIKGRYGSPCGAWSSFQAKGWY